PARQRPTLFPYTTLFRSVRDQKRVAVGRALRDDVRADGPAGARAIVDDQGDAERLTQRLREYACHRIDAPAGGRRGDDTDRLRRSEEHTSELQSRSDLVC